MRGAARAFGWELQRRHRWGVVALAVYLGAFWVVRLLILGPGHPMRLDPPNGLAAFVIAPVTITYFYFVGVFSFGLSGDLAARQSIYPARLLTLPVTTTALAGWPMLYGTVAASSLWFATAFVLRWPAGLDTHVPWIWPALLLAVYLAWMQALTWMPYGLRGARACVAAVWLSIVDVIVLLAIHFRAHEMVMVAVLAPQLPLAWFVARHAVARARRGDVPDWSGILARRTGRTRAPQPFTSAGRAHTWFEWRLHGRALPSVVAIVVPFELLLLFIPGNDTVPVVFDTLFLALLTPPLMAIFAAATVAKSTPFMTTRPLTTTEMLAAKLTAAMWSATAAWLIVLAAVPLALALSGTMPVFVERARAGIEVAGPVRAVAVVIFILAALWASTWKNLVQGLCIALTGREWLIKSTVVAAMSVFVVLGFIVEWLYTSRDALAVIWNGLPWILVGLVFVKACAAAWIAIRLHDRRLLSDKALAGGAACWLLAVLALYGVLRWFAASPLFPGYFLGAIAILSVPLARVAATPLALAWNRHR